MPWWVPRSSKPLWGVQSVSDVFDSHTSPPIPLNHLLQQTGGALGVEFRDVVMRGFSSTTDAMAAFDACREEGFSARLVTRPAAMGNAECGTALRTMLADDPEVADALQRRHVEVADVLVTQDYC